MTSAGHTGSHSPQLVHFSISISTIIYFLSQLNSGFSADNVAIYPVGDAMNLNSMDKNEKSLRPTEMACGVSSNQHRIQSAERSWAKDI
jgi:hypothetical protein